MNHPQPPQGLAVALEQLNAAVKSIVRKLQGKPAKGGRSEDRPDNPPPPAAR